MKDRTDQTVSDPSNKQDWPNS